MAVQEATSFTVLTVQNVWAKMVGFNKLILSVCSECFPRGSRFRSLNNDN